ncbi:hypothetical protein ABT160_17740 [Streptomyces sp. NPDC001941]|uniref:hypothetical protein n=1 Tax=Streptomyces sp. NPDC001941 TaxID=3154659 RepID=UPI00332B760F
MVAMRKALLVSVAAATVMGAGGAARAAGPEADVAHHGHVTLWDGRIGVWLASGNHGPSTVPNTTVRLAFSVPLAAAQALPRGCAWSGAGAVVCRTGPLRADGAAHEIALDLKAAGLPQEVTVRISTQWNGGAVDGNPDNNEHQVLVPATGDAYVF